MFTSRREIVLACLERMRRHVEAYNEAIRHNPEDARVHYNKGVVLSELGRKGEALIAYGEAIRHNPEMPMLTTGREQCFLT